MCLSSLVVLADWQLTVLKNTRVIGVFYGNQNKYEFMNKKRFTLLFELRLLLLTELDPDAHDDKIKGFGVLSLACASSFSHCN